MDSQLENRDSRTYRHRKCDGCTTLSGQALVYVSNIFAHPDSTYCSRCADYFPMHEFEWNDTGESLTDYYSRYAAMFHGLDRTFGSGDFTWALIAVGAIVGGVTGFLAARSWGTLAAIAGAGVGVIVVGFVAFVVGATIMHHVWVRVVGTSDITSLK